MELPTVTAIKLMVQPQSLLVIFVLSMPDAIFAMASRKRKKFLNPKTKKYRKFVFLLHRL